MPLEVRPCLSPGRVPHRPPDASTRSAATVERRAHLVSAGRQPGTYDREAGLRYQGNLGASEPLNGGLHWSDLKRA